MVQLLTAVFGVAIVGGAAAFAYAIYLTSGYHSSERHGSRESL